MRERLLIVDNFDSFTYNLVQGFAKIRRTKKDMLVLRDNEPFKKVLEFNPERLVISPGPGHPKDCNLSSKVFEYAVKTKKPLLGVCLGHQLIGYLSGAKVVRANNLMHGKTSMINFVDDPIFSGLKKPFQAMRYHSLCLDEKSLPKDLTILAKSSDDNIIMALKYKDLPIYGLQFHPESIMTSVGQKILKNFLNLKT
ncbi:MAG TPA: aminodeoxychorismate/anthranilate synthase component II [Thermodesulfobium narugense]|uniref:Anthranilate synthase component 2/anthranilate synthase/phosphoribosyltransferase n=1 Tax=Thermodesulfobium acidiphilum TaxID=1794699 RepID=A0A2R4W350_THEAF|nr:aminodeoxychorismate/anthranilate synthase component II [Thermodesulfobium acidiphilum]AWB11128.1 anthranilate synthase component 2/anthranilate synthase/phosphoribosyltransferase [Thermodesulfobium acidiphilum]PMP84534.1 MAG: aminodeoxychorismate/anthranilate synthase component II [Thermodesulfobium narugense]HEM56188.1 aminodeoxychorismate/anthranilate synthase component II [Thermodesulfobium narugense]